MEVLKNAPAACPVFHVPHDGDRFPAELMESVCVPAEQFLQYHERMRDASVWDMVPGEYRVPVQAVRFPVSRLLCDVERFIGPEEIMERLGMGFCYEKAYDGRVIKRVTEAAKAAARPYYDAHHRRMNRLCEKHPYMIFFDMHSYWDGIIPPFARVPGMRTPDLCLGTDPRFTPPRLTAIVRERFEAAGFTTAENVPYSGLYVPEDVLTGRSACDFIGIMLEFNRRAYCDERGRTEAARIRLIRSVIRQVMADCADEGEFNDE